MKESSCIHYRMKGDAEWVFQREPGKQELHRGGKTAMKAEAGCECANISDANITVKSGNGKFPTLIRQTGAF